jgi:MscS family membrane protein
MFWKIGVIGTLLLAVYWGCKFFLHFRKKEFLGKVNLEKVFFAPLKLLLLSLGIYYALVLSNTYYPIPFLGPWASSMKNFCVLSSLFWMSYRWKEELFKGKWAMFPMIEMVHKLVSIALWILFLLTSLRIFHVDVLPLLAFGGIGAAALGFGAKDVFGNFLSGGMLSITRPFARGDKIYLPDRQLEGDVEEIGWYFTSLRDKNKCPIYFPNALFSSVAVINLSRMTHRRIYEVLHVSFEQSSRILSLTKALRKLLQESSSIDLGAPILVYWNATSEDSLEMIVDVYTKSVLMEEYVLVKEQVLEQIHCMMEEFEVPLSYPTSQIQVARKKL